MAVGNTSYSALITRTLEQHSDEIFDNVGTNNSFLWAVKKNGNMKVRAGGRAFTHPLIYGTNTSFDAYADLATIPTPNPDLVTRAFYNVKTVAGSITLSDLEEAMNAGDKEKLLDYVEEKKLEAEISMGEVLGDQLWGNQTAAEDLDGLQRLISTTASTQTDVGGITGVANTYWRNYLNTTGTAAFNTSLAGVTLMDAAVVNSTFGNLGPTAVYTTPTVWSLYQVGQSNNIRYIHQDYADAGFKTLDYAGMPVLFDDNVPTGRMYFVDHKSLWFQVLARGNMKMSEFRHSVNQLGQVGHLYVFCNLTCGSRRTQGLLTGITG